VNAQQLRLGAVPYLNACVLVHGLADRDEVVLEFHPPSVLAKKLASGELDVALASSIEYLRHPEYVMVPGLSISGLLEMWSIRLFHRVPLTTLQKVALDPASETTNALLQLLLETHVGVRPAYVLPEPSPDQPALAGAPDVDAFLRIGDPALTFREAAWQAWDLQAAWHALTGLPFVYGLWLARTGTDVDRLGLVLRRCRDEGLQQTPAIAEREAASRGLTCERAREYISRIVRYTLGEDERTGLRTFQEFLLRSRVITNGRRDL